MRTLFIAAAALAASAPASPQAPPPGPVTVEVPMNVADSMRKPARDEDDNAATLLNLDELTNADNYPELAIEREVTGKVRVRVKVNEQGLATHCVTLGSPAPELGGPTCALFLAKARFSPARDRKGRPVKSTYTRTVRWALEDMEPQAFADATALIRFRFDADATIIECSKDLPPEYAKEAGPDAPDPCEAFALPAKMLAGQADLPDLDEWELRMEKMIRTGKEEFWSTVASGPDDRLVSVIGYKLEVNPDGSIKNCEPVHPKALEAMLPINCEQSKGARYVPSTEPLRAIAIVEFVYFHRIKPTARTS